MYPKYSISSVAKVEFGAFIIRGPNLLVNVEAPCLVYLDGVQTLI